MILRAKHKAGWLDVGSLDQTQGVETINFLRCLRPNQTIEVPDDFRSLRNISSAISAGLLEVVSYGQSPGEYVVKERLDWELASSSSSESSSSTP